MNSNRILRYVFVVIYIPFAAFCQELDSLRNLLAYTDLPDQDRARINKQIADFHDLNEDYRAAIISYREALKYYRILGWQNEIASVLNALGRNYSFSSNDSLAMRCFRAVLALEDQISQRSLIADAMHNMGIVYEYESQPDSSFYYFKKALELRQMLGDTSKIASSMRAMGEILRGMERFQEAMDHCLKALSMKDHIKDKRVLANIYNEVGYLLELQGQLDSALHYYRRLTELCNEIGFRRGESIGLANSAVILDRLGNYEKALEFHFKALEIDLEIDYTYGFMKDYFLIAETYYHMNRASLALDFLRASDSLCDAKWSTDAQEIQELYYLLFKQIGRYDRALIAHEQYSLIKDSISSIRINSKIAQLNAEYQQKEKEREIRYLKSENELQDHRLQLGTSLLIASVLIGLLSLIVFYMVVRQKELRIKNMHTELRNFLLEVQELKNALSDRKQWENNKVKELLEKYEITEREADVLHMISHGYSNSQIADKLFISINTVKYHIKNLYLKLDANNRVEIINRFAPDGLAWRT